MIHGYGCLVSVIIISTNGRSVESGESTVIITGLFDFDMERRQ
jgi:hypothetical protein